MDRETMPVAQKSTRLKLYTEQPPKAVKPPIEAVGSLSEVLRSFQLATGWSLRYVAGPEPKLPSDRLWTVSIIPGKKSPPGYICLEEADSGPAADAIEQKVDFNTARTMAAAIVGLLEELIQARHALWLREAELATGIPLTPSADEETHLAQRLQTTLRGAAEAVDCQAAALYLLDEATTQLKMRSGWGLPFERLMAPARNLQGELADLEALLGHAVVLENTALMTSWKVPEPFASAICVPISSSTSILGTMWVFGDEVHDFTDQQVHIIEIVAGKLASDLEREVLLKEGLSAAKLKKQWNAAERLQRNQLPTISPIFDNWQISGWASQAQELGGAFYDWFCLPEGMVALSLGDATSLGLEGAMSACAIKTAARTHGQYQRQSEKILQKTNLTLWTSSAGDQFAEMFCGLLETATGRMSYSSAGNPSVLLLRQDDWKSLSHHSTPLGESPETDYEPFGHELEPGEALVVFNNRFQNAANKQGMPLDESVLGELLSENMQLSADQLSAMARECLSLYSTNSEQNDLAILIVKRTGP